MVAASMRRATAGHLWAFGFLSIHVSIIDHAASCETGDTAIMAAKSKILSTEEFASLLLVGNTSAVTEPPAVIPFEHSAKLIAQGYMMHLVGRLRMTFEGRQRIREDLEN
jgi:hypothetical protein